MPLPSCCLLYTSIKRISFALCILAVLSGIAFWYYQSHLEQFKFHGAETFTMTFGQSHELSDSGYSQAKDILKQRVEILAGEKNYIQSQEKNGDVTYVLPAKKMCIRDSRQRQTSKL